MPDLSIHSKSFLMPSFVMFPFIQCHHTYGLASRGGFAKPSRKEESLLSEATLLLKAHLVDTSADIIRKTTDSDR